MSLFDKVFKKPKVEITNNPYWKTMTAYTPQFTTWGGSIYESELVRSAIHIRALHISKMGVQFTGTAQGHLKTRLKNAPNEFQTWGQFLYRLSTILDAKNNAIIVPVLNDYGDAVGVFPVFPSDCSVVDVNGEPYLRYKFKTGRTACMEMSRCGIMTKHQYSDDIFGEDNEALRPTMEMVNIQQQAISEGVRSAATYRFMAQMDNFALDDDIVEERKKFSSKNFSKEAESGGLLLFPNYYSNVKQIDSKPFVVDTAQMQLIQTNVYNYFNVNEDVLQSKAIGDSWLAFYEAVCEPFAIQLSDVLTKMFFTNTEQSTGNRIYITANRLQYMSTADKINYVKELGDRGYLTINEGREALNLTPLDEGGDARPIRGEFYNANTGEKLTDEETTDEE